MEALREERTPDAGLPDGSNTVPDVVMVGLDRSRLDGVVADGQADHDIGIATLPRSCRNYSRRCCLSCDGRSGHKTQQHRDELHDIRSVHWHRLSFLGVGIPEENVRTSIPAAGLPSASRTRPDTSPSVSSRTLGGSSRKLVLVSSASACKVAGSVVGRSNFNPVFITLRQTGETQATVLVRLDRNCGSNLKPRFSLPRESLWPWHW